MLEADLWSRLERNNFEAAYSVYLEAQERVLELKKDKAIAKYGHNCQVVEKFYLVIDGGIFLLPTYNIKICILENYVNIQVDKVDIQVGTLFLDVDIIIFYVGSRCMPPYY